MSIIDNIRNNYKNVTFIIEFTGSILGLLVILYTFGTYLFKTSDVNVNYYIMQNYPIEKTSFDNNPINTNYISVSTTLPEEIMTINIINNSKNEISIDNVLIEHIIKVSEVSFNYVNPNKKNVQVKTKIDSDNGTLSVSELPPVSPQTNAIVTISGEIIDYPFKQVKVKSKEEVKINKYSELSGVGSFIGNNYIWIIIVFLLFYISLCFKTYKKNEEN